MRQKSQAPEDLIEVRGEVLVLFRDGLSRLEIDMFLHQLYAREYNQRQRYVQLKQPAHSEDTVRTTDGFGFLLSVPRGFEQEYIELLKRDPHIQFAQRHHRIRERASAPKGH